MMSKPEGSQKAIDLSHHLSELSKARQNSPLKDLWKHLNKPGVIGLANGMPSPVYFPFSTLSANTLVQDSFALSTYDSQPEAKSSLGWFWRLFKSDSRPKERTLYMEVPKYLKNPQEVSLAVALQYGTAQGLIALQKFITEFTAKVFQPQYKDFTTLVHVGNTDGWNRALQTFCDPGEIFLTEEWTYPSALYTARPFGIHSIGIKVDGEGMRSDDLRRVLAEWDENERGAKRPHLVYTVPVGQNPLGTTMSARRRKEIYDICVEYDVLIVEDDPYYFLQQGQYVPPKYRKRLNVFCKAYGEDDDDAYIASLVPSYLKFDYQGRVIRLDTFSKTIAPGARLGWFTCNPVFAERLERQGETSAQAPCGFGQAMITQLLTKQWGYSGYIRWLRGLQTEYISRRDFFVDQLNEQFHLHPVYISQGSWSGCSAYVARAKQEHVYAITNADAAGEKLSFGEKALFSFDPPTAGMFIWLKVHFENHATYTAPKDKAELEKKLWADLVEAKVLVVPGHVFAASEEIQQECVGHYRIAFSYVEFSEMKEAVIILRRVLLRFFGYPER